MPSVDSTLKEPLADVDHIRATVTDLAIRFGPRLLTALIILAAGVFAGRAVSRSLTRWLQRLELEPPVRELLARVGWAATMLLFVILALQNLGVELLPLIAGLGVAGAGVALATQGVLSNVVAGLSIIFTRPFRVGEYVAIAGVEGAVDSITLFNTTLTHVDRSRVVVPNRKIVGEILHNYGTIRQLTLTVGVAYDTDLPAAFALIDAVLRGNPRILREPAPVVGTAALGDWAITIAIQPWVKVADAGAAAAEVNRAILESFREQRIVMPVPQREVRLIGAS